MRTQHALETMWQSGVKQHQVWRRRGRHAQAATRTGRGTRPPASRARPLCQSASAENIAAGNNHQGLARDERCWKRATDINLARYLHVVQRRRPCQDAIDLEDLTIAIEDFPHRIVGVLALLFERVGPENEYGHAALHHHLSTGPEAGDHRSTAATPSSRKMSQAWRSTRRSPPAAFDGPNTWQARPTSAALLKARFWWLSSTSTAVGQQSRAII
jgi:hypothetical protein